MLAGQKLPIERPRVRGAAGASTIGLGSESQKKSPYDRVRRIAARILQRGRLRHHRDRDPQSDRTRILEILYSLLSWSREIMRPDLVRHGSSKPTTGHRSVHGSAV
jgi:hypothetical protein